MTEIAKALAGTHWQSWRRIPLAGDASARSYVRLEDTDGQSVIVMHSGPVPTKPFVEIAEFLCNAGLAAPQILLDKSPILVIEDLGPTTIAKAMDDGAAPAPLYAAAIEVLVKLHQAKVAPLLSPSWEDLGQAVAITCTYYAPNADPDILSMHVVSALERYASHLPRTVAMRDCHAENLIWRPERTGTDAIGLLDFQDALLMPAGYDLVSLLRDVRRDVPEALVDTLTTSFCAKTGLSRDLIGPATAAMGAQRNLRILGVFGRLIKDHNKMSYAQHLPRTWRALQSDLRHPALAALKQYVDDTFPDPSTWQVGA